MTATPKRPKLETVFFAFLEQRLLAENVDKIVFAPEHSESKRADYLLDGRNIVIEVKRLDDDRVDAAQTALDAFRASPDWPLNEGEVSMGELGAMHPRGEALLAEIYDTITTSLKRAFEEANRQIRGTKVAIGKPDAMGIVVFLNDGVDYLDPKLASRRLGQLIRQAEADGSRRYESVDSAIMISWAHTQPGAGDRVVRPAVSVAAEQLTQNEWEQSFEVFLLNEWSAYLKVPIQIGKVVTTQDEFDALAFESDRPNPPLDGNPLPPE